MFSDSFFETGVSFNFQKKQIRNNRRILAQVQTVSTLYEEYAKVYCTFKSAIIIGPDHKLRSASYQNLPICIKMV